MLSEQIISVSIATTYLGILILLAELLSRWLKTDFELTRKIVHIGTGNIIILAWWLNISSLILVWAAVVASIIAIISYFLPILPSVNSVGRKSLGTLFYAVSIGILSGLFWQEGLRLYSAIGILVMSYGDGMAALVGRKWGRHPYQILGNQKSWEGSLTMALVSFVVGLTVLSLAGGWQGKNLLIALIMSICATILETISQIGIDNLTVPIVSAIICYYCQKTWL